MEFRSQKWRERANLHIVNRFYLLLFDNCVVVDCVVAERMLSFWHRHRQQEQSACPFSQRAVELMLMQPRIRYEQIIFQKSTFPQSPETIGTSFSRCEIAQAAFLLRRSPALAHANGGLTTYATETAQAMAGRSPKPNKFEVNCTESNIFEECNL